MKFCLYMSENEIDTDVPTAEQLDGAQGGGRQASPETLRGLGYLPLSETEKPADTATQTHEARYAVVGDGDERKVIQSWIAVDKPSARPRRYSKYKILGLLKTLGKLSEFISWIKADDERYEFWSAASVILETDNIYIAFKPAAVSMLGITEDEFENYMEQCVLE